MLSAAKRRLLSMCVVNVHDWNTIQKPDSNPNSNFNTRQLILTVGALRCGFVVHIWKCHFQPFSLHKKNFPLPCRYFKNFIHDSFKKWKSEMRVLYLKNFTLIARFFVLSVQVGSLNVKLYMKYLEVGSQWGILNQVLRALRKQYETMINSCFILQFSNKNDL